MSEKRVNNEKQRDANRIAEVRTMEFDVVELSRAVRKRRFVASDAPVRHHLTATIETGPISKVDGLPRSFMVMELTGMDLAQVVTKDDITRLRVLVYNAIASQFGIATSDKASSLQLTEGVPIELFDAKLPFVFPRSTVRDEPVRFCPHGGGLASSCACCSRTAAD